MTAELLPLDVHIHRLLAFCERVSTPLPRWHNCLVLDTSDPRVTYVPGPDHGWRLSGEPLCSVTSFASRFQDLLVTGYSWINLSAYGLFRGDLIIGVEVPRERTRVPAGLTSVNYSGPSLDPAGRPNWDLNLKIAT